MLPFVGKAHPLHKEWDLRTITADSFCSYLKSKNTTGPVLDLGCGNGWFTNHLSKCFANGTIYGMDVNIFELEQAARLFQSSKVKFIYGDVFEDIFENNAFALIVLNSSIQYFPNAKSLLTRLIDLLQPAGEIHLLDSPLYASESARTAAQERTAKYYREIGAEAMTGFYHHHSFRDLQGLPYDLLHDPTSWGVGLKRLFRKRTSPFPWIRIVK
jgi:trans-aconitate methyltransferase